MYKSAKSSTFLSLKHIYFLGESTPVCVIELLTENMVVVGQIGT